MLSCAPWEKLTDSRNRVNPLMLRVRPSALHLLVKVQARIGVEDIRRIGCGHHEGQQSDPERPIEVERGQLRGHEGMHRAVDGPATQQIHTAPAELAGARSREHEAWWRRPLQDGVDDGQELRNPLNLVDHHRVLAGRPRKQLVEALGPGVEAAMQRGIEQVQVQGIREPVAQPGGLAGSAGAEQEAALVRDLEESSYKFHFESKNGNSGSDLRSTRTTRSIEFRATSEPRAASAIAPASISRTPDSTECFSVRTEIAFRAVLVHVLP